MSDASETVTTFCRICQAYCGLEVELRNGTVQRIRGDRSHPESRGYTCVKGRSLGALHTDPRRLLVPRLNGDASDWPSVLDDLVDRLANVIGEHGSDAVGVFRGTAAYFDSAGVSALGHFVGGLATRSLYTTSTIDQVARFWVAEQMSGVHHALPLIDQERCRLTILVGTNPPVSHGHVNSWPDPVVRLRNLSSQGELWCLDVRRTETARLADRFLQPAPSTDWAVLAHVVREILAEGADAEFIAEHSTHVERLREAVEPITADLAATICGVQANELADLVEAVRAAGRIAVQTGTGSTMSRAGDLNEWMAWALMAITGSLDRPGGVWFSRGYAPQRRPAPVAAEEGPRSRPGLAGRFGERPTAALADEIEAGHVRALIVAGANPLRAVPGSARLATAFGRLDALAVLDIHETATVAAASHVLPTTAQFERSDVSMVQTMYPVPAVQYTPALLPAPGQTRPMAEVLGKIGAGLGVEPIAGTVDQLLRRVVGDEADALWDARILVGAPEFGWFTDTVLSDARWDLAPSNLVERLVAQWAADATPSRSLTLAPRRQIGHMNTLLAGASDAPHLLIHPDDANRHDLADGDPVAVSTERGTVEATVRIDAEIRAGVVSLPHGFNEPNISDLTVNTDDVHPEYGMPTLAGVPVTLHRPARAAQGS